MSAHLRDLLRRCYDLYQDAHEGECGAALEQGEDECTCGAEQLMAQIEQVFERPDAAPTSTWCPIGEAWNRMELGKEYELRGVFNHIWKITHVKVPTQ